MQFEDLENVKIKRYVLTAVCLSFFPFLLENRMHPYTRL